MIKELKKSPINYFSDLFIAVMVIAWIAVILIMVIMGIYSTIQWGDNSIWTEVSSLVAVPLSCGGAIWMVKNSVQHAIANNKGKECPMDFPAVTSSEEWEGKERPLGEDEDDTEDEVETADMDEAVG